MMHRTLALKAALTAVLALAGCSGPLPTAPDAAVAGAGTAGTAVRGGGPPPFVFPDGCCYYAGEVVRTVVPPASNPRVGRDNFYAVTNGVPGQKAIVAVAPGDRDYHGGHWKFHAVTFRGAPYLLTSEAAVLAAEAAGDVTIARDADRDFKCPIQP